MAKEIALDWIESHKEEIIQVSDQIWQYAEVGLKEHNSSSLLIEKLRSYGFAIERGVAGLPTAFIASWGGGEPQIGILCEYDALPGLSQEAVPYRKPIVEGGPGHGCGHNLMAASTMAAAIAAKIAMEKEGIRGAVKLFGCPAEEQSVGKVYMVKEKLFDKIDACLSYHPWDENTVTYASFIAMRSIKFQFHGEPAHASRDPEKGRSALDAVELMNVGVNYLREHVPNTVRMHYVITQGGESPNIVPPEAEVWYYLRSPKSSEIKDIYKRVYDIARGASLMTGTTVKAQKVAGASELLPNETLTYLVCHNLEKVGPPVFTKEEERFAEEIRKTIDQKKGDILAKTLTPPTGGYTIMGSTDVGDVSWKSPTTVLFTGTWVPGTAAHSWQATSASGMGIGHKAMIVAAKTLALSALDLFSDKKALRNVRKEYLARKKGERYLSPLLT